MFGDQIDRCEEAQVGAGLNKQDEPVSSGNVTEDCFADVMHARIEKDPQVREYLARNKIHQMVDYLCSSASGLSVLSLAKEHVTAQVAFYRDAHLKSVTKAVTAMKAADECMARADYQSAIQHYSKAICAVPRNLDRLDIECRMARLYGKRSVCLFMINSVAEAEFDYKTCSRLDEVAGIVCLQKVVDLLSNTAPGQISPQVGQWLSREILQQKTNLAQPVTKLSGLIKDSATHEFEPNVVFDVDSVSLWFNNRAKGKRHSAEAHFACAKKDIEAGTKVLEEKPLVSVCSQLDSTCAGCGRLVQMSFWPCDTCDEVVFCDVACFNSCLHHKSECGLASYMRSNLSPLATILLHQYIRSQCLPEYSAKSDLVERASLPTDADIHFAGRANPSRLPKRSYQYRYFLLANSKAKKDDLTSHKLISTEAMLALRESANNKDEVLPAIVHNKLSTIVFESILVLIVLELATNKAPNKLQDRLVAIIEDYQRLYRFNTAQAVHDSATGSAYFVQPIVGTFFWPDCQPNVQVTYCAAKDSLVYHTTRAVPQFDKLLVPFPVDYLAQRDPLSSCRCLSCVQAQEKTLKKASAKKAFTSGGQQAAQVFSG